MLIKKSSNHKKIIGDFGEQLVCNWLSRSGFEVAIVDHTGIDLIAYNPSTKQRFGITVKSRTRTVGKEEKVVNLPSTDERQKVLDACNAFACEPWIGIYVEASESADVYLTSLKNYDEKYSGTTWKMGEKEKELYEKDPDIKHVRFVFEVTNWFH